jgi:hypothetical protein
MDRFWHVVSASSSLARTIGMAFTALMAWNINSTTAPPEIVFWFALLAYAAFSWNLLASRVTTFGSVLWRLIVIGSHSICSFVLFSILTS